MKKILIAGGSLVVVALVALLVSSLWKEAPLGNLSADIYPLYSGATWSEVQPKTFEKMTGFEVTAVAAKDTTNITEATSPFEKYYAEKLTAEGWTVDNSLAAGGPGASITAYAKDGNYIIISFSTDFKAGGENEPVQCPCDVSLSIFSGKDITNKLISEVAYKCDAGKTIEASYFEGPASPTPKPGEPPIPTGSVLLKLSDGREIKLPQTISASGIRYATTNDSFVFFSKGDTALILENNEQTYTGCVSGTGEPGGSILPYNSGVRGVVIMGPTCPGPVSSQENCADKPYKTLITIFPANDPVHAFAFTNSKEDGTFSVALPPGEYILGAGESRFPNCEHPKVTVKADMFTETNISCDTGIR